ncbi:hypothetical protein P43SY_008684 [Pythium insidiosum]|uniref:RBR-type E3 ubiquitin transferase n=1 Tax=Pythium insidiosum TaxID=114742 RepID=A0AAD5Q9N2_PYTIN|nr:hypothetical protein P43SY_008684 [Pythium insidiosum]
MGDKIDHLAAVGVQSPPPAPPALHFSRSISVNSDDEYNYSDLEDEYDPQDADEDDDDEYILEEDDSEDMDADSGRASDLSASSGRRRGSADHANGSHSSVAGASGSAPSKKKRLSGGNSGISTKHGIRVQDEYRVIEEEELFAQQRKLITEISQVLETSTSVAAVLLRHFAWNKEKLFEGYYLDPTKARHEAGVEFADVPPPTFADGQEIDCLICCDTYKPNEIFGMGCQHVYCVNCWKSYLSLKITEGPACVNTTCPAHGCKEAVPDSVFRKMLTADEFARYSRFVLRSYLIECRRVLKYTYVFGYYLPPGKEKSLFEYLQENLEKNTEHLTGLSEMPLDKMNRAEIVNYTRVTETFLRNLLAGVEDGLTSAGATIE